MTTISIAMIAHNESRCIANALRSVIWADQIVVVDCGSSDDTVVIAEEFGVDIVKEINRANLNVNKNIALDHCTSDWVFVLDADEIIPDDLTGEIRAIINDSDASDGYLVPRRNFVLGRWMKHGGNYPDLQLRLFRREKGHFPAKHVHERIKIDGKVEKTHSYFDHHPYVELSQMFDKGKFYVNFEARFMYERGIRITPAKFITNGLMKPQIRFFRRYVLKGGFLDGVPGFASAFLDAWNMGMRWVRLWEIEKNQTVTDG